MGVADKDDLQQCRNEREMRQAEFLDVNSRIEVLDRENLQYQLFFDVRNDKCRIGLLVADYLNNVTIYTDGRTAVEMIR